ncbi:MAG: Hsp70 family protein [Spirochaetales bacterium]|nr:Hsp70 family protein [Spirochaetales bacterium]
MIGIKIADGSYIPILDETDKSKKKVILTTVRDAQPSVQIDLYRSADSGMMNPSYLGSLKLDDLENAQQGEPEIELLVNIDEDGNLVASVRDLNGENEKSLAVGIDSASSGEPDGSPDFTLSSPAEGGDEKPDKVPKYSSMNGQSIYGYKGKKNNKPLILIASLAMLFAAIVAVGIIFLFPRPDDSAPVAQKPESSRPQTVQSAPKETAPPVQPAQPPYGTENSAAQKPAAPPPAQKPAPAAPAQAAKPAPAAGAGQKNVGVWYTIVKGDNLWNLSKSFYRTPWLYKKIAVENGIKNPDLIFRNNRIYIPDVETARRK